MIWIIGTFIVLTYLFTWTLCAAAGKETPWRTEE